MKAHADRALSRRVVVTPVAQGEVAGESARLGSSETIVRGSARLPRAWVLPVARH